MHGTGTLHGFDGVSPGQHDAALHALVLAAPVPGYQQDCAAGGGEQGSPGGASAARHINSKVYNKVWHVPSASCH
jgi:hypothetical protein